MLNPKLFFQGEKKQNKNKKDGVGRSKQKHYLKPTLTYIFTHFLTEMLLFPSSPASLHLWCSPLLAHVHSTHQPPLSPTHTLQQSRGCQSVTTLEPWHSDGTTASTHRNVYSASQEPSLTSWLQLFSAEGAAPSLCIPWHQSLINPRIMAVPAAFPSCSKSQLSWLSVTLNQGKAHVQGRHKAQIPLIQVLLHIRKSFHQTQPCFNQCSKTRTDEALQKCKKRSS